MAFGLKDLAESEFFIPLVTQSFLNDLKQGDTRVIAQLETAKMMNKKAIVLLDSRLSDRGTLEAGIYLSSLNVVKTIVFDANDMRKAAAEIKAFLGDDYEIANKDMDRSEVKGL